MLIGGLAAAAAATAGVARRGAGDGGTCGRARRARGGLRGAVAALQPLGRGVALAFANVGLATGLLSSARRARSSPR